MPSPKQVFEGAIAEFRQAAEQVQDPTLSPEQRDALRNKLAGFGDVFRIFEGGGEIAGTRFHPRTIETEVLPGSDLGKVFLNLEQERSKAIENLAKSEFESFRSEVKTARDVAAIDLESELTGLADQEFMSLFKPKIRQSLSAAGILKSGALAETLAKTRADLQAPVEQRVSQFKQATTELDLSLGLAEVQQSVQADRERAIFNFNESVAGTRNDLLSELSAISTPNALQSFLPLVGGLGSFAVGGSSQSRQTGPGLSPTSQASSFFPFLPTNQQFQF